ncbi:oxidoreductase [Dongia deserti]|uniref:oxidoreductase n=1 Tax=Dongia deserti TaxID=2268030 RepID=UPI000E64E75E|nr:FAD-dependent oxidoreductase [Dongia deserti]
MTISIEPACYTNPKHKILFEPVRIGPVVAPNRFYQTPYATGFGFRDPKASAKFREVRAEGGWGVVGTEQTEIHSSSDMTPYIEGRLWDDSHIAGLALSVDAIHRHGALAALELSHGGLNVMNAITRDDVLGPSCLPLTQTFPTLPEPGHCRAMSLEDIKTLREWHAQAAVRGLKAGFDIIYVYASLVLSLPAQYLSLRYNKRTDQYGGALENRVRLLRELIEDTIDAVQGKCAVAVRITLDELLASPVDGKSELEEFFAIVGELPDLWDIVVGGYGNDSGSAQFGGGDIATSVVKRVKALTTKPVVSVGCFTQPDIMTKLILEGVVDLIGAARPSIADPFLPKKIASGRGNDVIKCVACNLCVASDFSSAPIRCPQNPTSGEELRRGWHPVHVGAVSRKRCLVVGAGPAGLECSRLLAAAGHEVTIVEQQDYVGGRVTLESLLPGMSRWRDLVSWRHEALLKDPAVKIKTSTRAVAGAWLSDRYDHIILATGSRWRKDGIGQSCHFPVQIDGDAVPLTPDDVLRRIQGGQTHWPKSVTVYDDEHYYVGSLVAEHLAAMGCHVTFVTPAAEVAVWTHKTMEQTYYQSRMIRSGITILPHYRMAHISRNWCQLENVFVGSVVEVAHDAIVLVTAREPNRELHDAPFIALPTVRPTLAGDASAPGTLVHVTYDAHRVARTIIEADSLVAA